MNDTTLEFSSNNRELLRRQQALAEFGAFVLDHEDLDLILTEACRIVSKALKTDLAKVVEIDREHHFGFIKAGVGWTRGIVGKTRLDLKERSSEAYAIALTEPVITNDIVEETRFHFPKFMRDHGVRALVNVPILLPGRIAYGVLQVDAREPRHFDGEDIDFLKTYAMTLGPVIDRLRKISEAQAADDRLRRVLETDAVGILFFDASGFLIDANDAFLSTTGYSREAVKGGELHWRNLTPPEYVADSESRMHVLEQTGRIGPYEKEYIWADGSRHWMLFAGRDLGDRTVVEYAIDLTDRKRAEEALREADRYQRMLHAELQHRVRNTLGVIRSIARRTAENSGSVEEMLAHFEGRLDAFSRVQASLTRNSDIAVNLISLIEDELVAHAVREGEQVTIKGTPIMLQPRVAERLSLAIHELTTNAVKYGALSREGGNILVQWRAKSSAKGKRLLLVWNESGVEIDTKPARDGFGMELLRRSLPYDLAGETTIDMRREGLRFELNMPYPECEAA